MKYIKWLLILATAASAKWLSFGGGHGAPTIDVNIKSVSGVYLHIYVPGVEYEMRTTDMGRFMDLNMPGYGFTTELGLPKIPVIRKFIEVPYGARTEATLENVITGHIYVSERIMPVQPSRPKTGEEIPFRIDTKFYSENKFYPEISVKVHEAGIVRGHRLFVLEIFPISYNPVTGEMRYLVSADVDIKFIGGNWSETIERTSRHSALPFDLKLWKDVLNYGIYGYPKPVLEVPMDYVFVVPDEWVTTLQPLVDWKKSQGYRVIVATLSQTGNSTDQIKAYLQSIYDDPDRNLTFITLVGDVDRIPSWTGYATDNPATDLYYTTLEGDDYFPDVYIGRLSVADESQLATVVNKIVRYESVDNWTNGTDWARYAYFMASSSNHQLVESTHVYCMRIVRRYGMETDSMWEYYHSGTPPVQAINAGRTISVYSGLGGASGWSRPHMNIEDVYSLNNIDMLTHVESYTSLSGKYTESECFMEAWLRAPNGAITAMGASAGSYWDEDDILQRRIFDEWFDSTYYWVAGNIVEGKYDLYLHYNGGGRTQMYYEMYNLFGDPSTDVFTLPPVEATVSMPGAIPVVPSQVQVHVEREGQPLAYALVTFIQDDSIIGQAYTDENGNAIINAAPLHIGEVDATIIGHNIIPYRTTLIAYPEGAYVGFGGYQLDDSGGNNNGRLDAGETVNITVMAINYGNQDAYGVVGTLSTNDPYVTITSRSVNYGNIASHDSVWSPSPYTFSVAPTVPDEHDIAFDITFTDSNDSTWVYRFRIRAYAPNAAYVSYTVVDTLNGNGNGVAEPGEEVEVWVTLTNTGHMDLNSVTATISTSAEYLTVVRDTASFGDISSGYTAASATPYVIQVSEDAPAPSFPSVDLSIQAQGGFAYSDSFRLIISRMGLFCIVEGDTVGWTHGGNNDLWHVSTRSYHSPTHSFYSGDEASGRYADNMDAWLMTPIVVLGENAQLIFWTKYDLETSYDYGYVEISTDGGSTWEQVATYSGTSDWVEENIDLSSYPAGSVVYIRFRQTSDGSAALEGWYVDDIALTPPGVLTVSNIEVADTNGRLDPGDVNVPVVITVMNPGGTPISNVTGLLTTSSPYITIIDSEGVYGTILPDSSAVDTFVVNVSSNATVGTIAEFTLSLVGDNGNYTANIDFQLAIGDSLAAPTGPDAGGYYIYDGEDPGGRLFQWIEVENIGTPLNLGDDDIANVALPWPVTFYGQTYNNITVCSNGWIAFGTTNSNAYLNTGIPNTSEPNAIVAGVWDDLNPTLGGNIYTYYDTTNNLFVIEYKGVPHYGAPSDVENFEIVILPTTSGSDNNNEILINYLTAPSQQDITVGIENETGTVGLQYMYDGEYDSYAHPITDSFTLYITCNTPGVAEEEPIRPLTFALMPAFPNPMMNSTSIRFALPHKANVELNIYDASGRMVKTLADGTFGAGFHTLRWNGTNNKGIKLPAGVYIYRLKADGFVATKKLVMVK